MCKDKRLLSLRATGERGIRHRESNGHTCSSLLVLSKTLFPRKGKEKLSNFCQTTLYFLKELFFLCEYWCTLVYKVSVVGNNLFAEFNELLYHPLQMKLYERTESVPPQWPRSAPYRSSQGWHRRWLVLFPLCRPWCPSRLHPWAAAGNRGEIISLWSGEKVFFI